MATAIVPAIIGERFADVAAKLKQLHGLVPWVQIDVVDGLFAMPASWPYRHKENIAELQAFLHSVPKLQVELHLMQENPESAIDAWISSGAHRILLHVESTPQINAIIEHCEEGKIGFNGGSHVKIVASPAQAGVVLKLDTEVHELEQIATPPKFIQLMSIASIGSYGAVFDETVFAKIAKVRQRYPHARISIDGGVTLANAPELIAAGVHQLVVGSAIWKSGTIAHAIRAFEHL
ncbi:MAG: hypothetical protein A2542_02205 [Parcubacteria group bacterium RIFOXYD2_FULL_52_8]|nr:MAG: hypothetical protein A2542_02205 [Parcubacteria group bacterium RIFOXYD2_FULL_52_8]